VTVGPLPAEVEKAIGTIHEAAYEGLCHKYHPQEKEWWADVIKAEAVLKSALRPKVVSREDVDNFVTAIYAAGQGRPGRISGIPDNQAPIDWALERIRELGIEVGEKP
jgi:hypothetical protein